MAVTPMRNIIAKIQAHALTAGAKEAPTDPVESNVRFPFSACYPGTGRIMAGASETRKDIDSFVLALHVNRAHLPIDVKTAETFYDAFGALLVADPTLGGTVNTILLDEGIGWEFGNMKWGGLETVGFKFTIPVKNEE